MPADSFYPWYQKFADFNSMKHRCINLPLNKDNQEKKIEKIETIASNLGYTKSSIDELVQKHKTKKLIKDAIALLPDNEEKKIIKVTFYPKLTNKIKKVFRKQEIQPIFTNNNKIKNLLGNTKTAVASISCQNCRGI